MIDIKFDKTDMIKTEWALRGIKNGAKKALVTATNKTAKTTKVQVRKKLGKELNLKAARINKNLSVNKANYRDMSASLTSTGKPIGLINFGAKQLKKGTKVKVLKSSQRTLIPHAFIATSKKAKNVWRRKEVEGKRVGRLPIERLTGPRIEDILAKPGVVGPLTKDTGALLQKNLDKKVDSLLRRHRG